jgi:SH3 domain-containing YSC84-like protein 1
MIRLALMASICSCALLVAADTPQERITDANSVFNEIMATPDKGIPRDLLEKAHCIVIVPGLKQAAFGVGGKFGRGYAICRREKAGWGAPAAIRVERRVPMSSCW